jgi:CO/xanthine dehydrogenase Mo-binding subunit
MHASVGPSCAVALYEKDALTVWSHSQGVFPLRASLASLVDLPEDKIRIIGVPGSGCYGHNGADDVAADAALVAQAFPGKHVRLQWSREDEHGWEPYGSAMKLSLSANLSGQGEITAWTHDLWSDTHSTRPGGDPGNLLASRYISNPQPLRGRGFLGGGYRNSQPYYNFSAVRVDAHFFQGPFRVSALRGLGAYANIFAIESFMDELAQKAGMDPFDFRLAHLDDDRARTVLKKLREMISQAEEKEQEGIGIAFARYKNTESYCAVAALVNNSGESPRVKSLWGVVDAGEVINPDGLANQVEGGMIQSTSWTLFEQVQASSKRISTLDWDSYPILRTPDVPETQVAVIDRPDQPPLGAGETAQGPTAAAVVNGLVAAGGPRIRELPIFSKGKARHRSS